METSAIVILSILLISTHDTYLPYIFFKYLKNVKVPYVCNGFYNEKNIQVCFLLEGTSFVKVRVS